MNMVINSIRGNNKRMAKINGAKNSFVARDIAQRYVVAECAAQKKKLSEMEIIHATNILALGEKI